MTPPRSLRRWLRGVTLAVSALAPLAGSLLACGSVPPVSVRAAQTPREAFLAALVEARAARDSAYTCRAPGTSALSTLGADGAIDEALGAWAQRRAEATQQADKAYARALDLAPSPEDELVVRAELAELWFSVLDEAEVAVLSATPTTYRFNNELQTSLRAAAVATFAPVRSRVTRHLDHCVRLAGDDTGPGSYFQRCQDIALRLSAGTLLTPPDALPPAAPPKVDGKVAAAPAARPLQPTVRPRPCTFRGTLAIQGRLYDGEHAEKPSMELTSAEPVEVDTLELPRTPGGRYRIAIKAPVERQGWLEAPAGALVLRRRVDLVADHVWAPEGLRVQAADARGPTVRIMSVGARGRPQPGVTALDRRIFCYDLALASPLVPVPAVPAATGKVASFRGPSPVPLFARAGGKQIAKLPPTAEPSVLEVSGAFSHVAGSVPFLFDGWVRTPSVGLAAAPGQR